MTFSHLMNRLRQDVQGVIREAAMDGDFVLCFDAAADFAPFLVSKANLMPLSPKVLPWHVPLPAAASAAPKKPLVKAKKKGK